MSYILDALKKAEAERNTGTAPGPLLAAAPAALAQTPAKRSAWLWLALAAPACVLLVFVWLKSAPQSSGAPAIVAQSVPVAASPVAQKRPEPPPQEAREDAPQEMLQEIQQETPPKAKTVRKAAMKKDPAPAAASIATLGELPASIRQEIPALKVGGYIYSANKAERSVLINNRLLREGDEAAPGLILERMQPNGMVLIYKGYQYRMSY